MIVTIDVFAGGRQAAMMMDLTGPSDTAELRHLDRVFL